MDSADLKRLFEKLRAIEALYARPGTDGERVAARLARDRLVDRITDKAPKGPGPDVPVEYKFTMADAWSRRVFVALLRRHGVRPYRYKRQRYTTVMANVSPRFVDETLWPQFVAFSETLESYLDEVTTRVVTDVLRADGSEATIVDASARKLPAAAATPPASTSYTQLDLSAQTSTAHDSKAVEPSTGSAPTTATDGTNTAVDKRSSLAAAAKAAQERRRLAAERKRKKRDRKNRRKKR